MSSIKLRFSGRYLFIAISLITSVIYTIPLIGFLTTKSEIPGDESYIGITVFYIIVISGFAYLFWTSFNMARKIIVDEYGIRILKSKEYRVIPFSQIRHITCSTGHNGGVRFFWIRKRDDIKKIETSFFTLSSYFGANSDERELLLKLLEKRTTVKKSRII